MCSNLLNKYLNNDILKSYIKDLELWLIKSI